MSNWGSAASRMLFRAPVDDAAPASAAIGPRAVARAIDMIFLSAEAVGAVRVAGTVIELLGAAHSIRPGWAERLSSPGPLAVLIFAAMLFAHDVIAESFGGATIGKLIMGLRVRDIELFPVSAAMTMRRALAALLEFQALGVPAVLFALRDGQRLGDRWAETLVVPSSAVVGDSASRALVGATLALFVAKLVAVGGVLVFAL